MGLLRLSEVAVLKLGLGQIKVCRGKLIVAADRLIELSYGFLGISVIQVRDPQFIHREDPFWLLLNYSLERFNRVLIIAEIRVDHSQIKERAFDGFRI